MAADSINMLVIASYFKGERFLEQAARRGVNVHLLTREKLLNHPWPRQALTQIYGQGNDATLQDQINAVSYLARNVRIDRLVPLDDYDVETAAAMREHLRLPGMGDSIARHFRDKLAMRVRARDAGIPVPEFVGILNYDAIRDFTARIPAPWMFKPRFEASASGITKIESTDHLWRHIESKGDRQSLYLLEKYLPGDVYHVDSVISEGQVVFAAVHRCGKPPFDVAHGGGIYTSTTVERGSTDDTLLRNLNERVLKAMGHFRGVSHVEFIKGRHDDQFYMLEWAARVGGAHTAELVEAANSVNLWEEWANVEIDGPSYVLPRTRGEYGGLLMTLAKQQHPNLSGFGDPEVFYRAPDEYHAGLVVRSSSHARVHELIETYARRFYDEFHTVLPAADRPVH
jgi:hypothetical protein